jgi:hypothetical protein
MIHDLITAFLVAFVAVTASELLTIWGHTTSLTRLRFARAQLVQSERICSKMKFSASDTFGELPLPIWGEG